MQWTNCNRKLDVTPVYDITQYPLYLPQTLELHWGVLWLRYVGPIINARMALYQIV